jgi:hypothetical protein
VAAGLGYQNGLFGMQPARSRQRHDIGRASIEQGAQVLVRLRTGGIRSPLEGRRIDIANAGELRPVGMLFEGGEVIFRDSTASDYGKPDLAVDNGFKSIHLCASLSDHGRLRTPTPPLKWRIMPD